jgi:IS5 family transposase
MPAHARPAAWALLAILGAWMGARAADRPPVPGGVGVDAQQEAEHRYRIIGKVRLLFFWVSADDVGGARIGWRGEAGDRTVSLLIGSDPERAPREVNEWGYVSERVTADATTVFGLRTVTDGDSPDQAEARRTEAGPLAELGVLCSTVSQLTAASRTTTVRVRRDATYRDIGRVLDLVEQQARWTRHATARPVGVAPGFLTAIDRMLRTSAGAARDSAAVPACPRLAYVYKDQVYDVIPRRVERLPTLRTASGVLRDLLRAHVVVRNRATGATSDFSITYGTTGALAGVPVAVRFQPNWWFRVELELDERADVPPDPAGDIAVSRRIATLCAPRAE